MQIDLTWLEFKNLSKSKGLFIQYVQTSRFYKLWMQEGMILYLTDIPFESPANTDQSDFEANYKSLANKSDIIRDAEGKQILRAESRPINTTTVFTCAGDDTEIGNGTELIWDFSNDDDLISVPSGSDYKRKRIEFKFLDSTWVKEGTLYFHNKQKRSYIDFYVVCPENSYYLDSNNQVQQATEDTPIVHYGIKIFMQGDCPMGDELNTEACSSKIPAGYKFWLEITVPNTDILSSGHVTLEMYRFRSVIL